MRTGLNIWWFIALGFISTACWYLIGVVLLCTVIFAPAGYACFRIGTFVIRPFGREVIARAEVKQKDGRWFAGFLGNVLWACTIGLFLAAIHVGIAIFQFCTIIGIPFGIQNMKIAGMCFMPFGKIVVKNEVAKEARRQNAVAEVSKLRGEPTPRPATAPAPAPALPEMTREQEIALFMNLLKKYGTDLVAGRLTLA